MEQLPELAQMAPVMAIALDDLDRDGHPDAVLAQNFNGAQRETGRMNAGLSLFLRGGDNGEFTALWPLESGISLRTDSRHLAIVNLKNDEDKALVFAPNSGRPQVFRLAKPGK